MYVTSIGHTYYQGTEQRHSRAPYAILASDDDNTLYACVRSVALRQLGHFMMGTARIGGQSIIVSGSFGADGLPLTVGRDIPRAIVDKLFVQVPDSIATLYWQYDGYHRGESYDPAIRAYLRGLWHHGIA
jgi:hypothetical protein